MENKEYNFLNDYCRVFINSARKELIKINYDIDEFWENVPNDNDAKMEMLSWRNNLEKVITYIENRVKISLDDLSLLSDRMIRVINDSLSLSYPNVWDSLISSEYRRIRDIVLKQNWVEYDNKFLWKWEILTFVNFYNYLLTYKL